MNRPARSFGWAGLVLLAGISGGQSSDICAMSDNTICRKLHSSLQLSCVKHVQLAVAACLKSRRTERFGSHEDHCRVACRAGDLAVRLDRRLRRNALSTVEQSAGGNEAWLSEAQKFWRHYGGEDDVCDDAKLQAAKTACEAHCASTAKRRDLDELQGLAAGKDFRPVQQPVFGCTASRLPAFLSGDDKTVLKWLYPPGHARRGTDAVE